MAGTLTLKRPRRVKRPRQVNSPAPGEVLALLPYYTVWGEWVTGLYIVNTSAPDALA